MTKDATAKVAPRSVDDYIARHPEEVRAILLRVRGAIRKALPGTVEGISYQMPTYKRDGGYVIYFAGWKQHYSLYPATDQLVAAFKDDLAPYKVTRGTIRFPVSQPVPVKLIGTHREVPREGSRRTLEGEGCRAEEAQVTHRDGDE